MRVETTERDAAPAPSRAETARLHTRFTEFLCVTIGGAAHHPLDWSVGGFALPAAALTTLGPETLDGDRVPVRLAFDLGAFVVTTEVTAELVVKSEDRLGFRFRQLPESKSALLRAIAFLVVSGRGATPEQVLFGGGSAQADAGRPAGSPRHRSIGLSARVVGRLLIVVIGLGLIAGAGAAAHLLRTKPTISRFAAVAAVAERVAVPVAGIVEEVRVQRGQPVTVGTPLLTVRAATGEAAVVASPCPCRVHARALETGATVVAGTPAITLVRLDRPDTIVIVAVVSPAIAERLRPGDTALTRVAGLATPIAGRVADPARRPADLAGLPDALSTGRDARTVVVQPAAPLPAEAIGAPASVRFEVRM